MRDTPRRAGGGGLLSSAEGEFVEVKGVNGTVIVDSGFVTIARKGFLARAGVGKGEKRIPLRQITAVQFKPAGMVVNGFIQFSLGGGNERQSRLGSQSWDAASDENSVMFTKQQQPQFEQLRSSIEQGITAGYNPSAGAPVATAAPDQGLVGQLNQLADLHRQGALTDQEFQAAKFRLINGPR
ncbi:DUF4429 domain-containing protein [Actinomycetospora soli]|uniref:DUF4429 domain-containing protein n=1 Tax=Actinomycetospora soli TaxID=2893887 RepID=UPI001E50D8BE|nr:DUF4429 domain-containing protein [Actinomycetospora soli]MCD2191001.1 DUF4429 domain-containing protein [Actinomycetospora soli]